jgi:hypothetical protein
MDSNGCHLLGKMAATAGHLLQILAATAGHLLLRMAFGELD